MAAILDLGKIAIFTSKMISTSKSLMHCALNACLHACLNVCLPTQHTRDCLPSTLAADSVTHIQYRPLTKIWHHPHNFPGSWYSVGNCNLSNHWLKILCITGSQLLAITDVHRSFNHPLSQGTIVIKKIQQSNFIAVQLTIIYGEDCGLITCTISVLQNASKS